MILDPNEKMRLDEQGSLIFNSNLTIQKTINELPTKSYVDNEFNDPSILKTTAHVDSMIKISITLDSLK